MDIDHFDADLRERLDRSFGDGPTHLPLDDRLVAGHRALLRRRIVHRPRHGRGRRGRHRYVVRRGRGRRPCLREAGLRRIGELRRHGADSIGPSLRRSRGRASSCATTARPRSSCAPAPRSSSGSRTRTATSPPKHSVGLTVSWKEQDLLGAARGRPRWEAAPATRRPSPRARGATSASGSQRRSSTNRPGGDDKAADFPGTNVRFDDSGRLVADEGYRIVEQRTGIDMPDELRPRRRHDGRRPRRGPGGERTWWLGRITDGFQDYIPYDAEPGQTVEQFLVFARGKYDAGVGLR